MGSELSAVLFPGQGSQTEGMREIVERRRPELLELARAEASDDFFDRADEGTRWAQPAIYCAALAGFDLLRDRVEPDVMAGHSLGEIAALVAAEALTAEDGFRLVSARGRLMQEAAEMEPDGGMLAVRARERAPVERVAEECGLTVANDNAPDQVVLSGPGAAIAAAEERLREARVRTKLLPVAGAFHSPLIEPAVEPFRAVVLETEVREPRVPVFSCVTAAPFDDVRERLVQALTQPVRWLDVMRALERRGVTRFVETGPGRVLANLVRKSLDGVEAEAPLAMEAASA
ncbi:MAG: ACP S-malonyltransferase [Thermoleophilaceae bacterium]|nr:ACP S-malonyltransferase [Thermoleophilaceae bacterium]